MSTALITGASRGIGTSIAEKLASLGYTVILGCFRHFEEAESLSRRLSKITRTGVCRFDVRSFAGVAAAAAALAGEFGFIDTVINNAGVSLSALIDQTCESDYDEVMNTNLKGVFNVCHAFVPAMISKKCGSIVNVASMWGRCGSSMESVYSASKGGVIAFTKALALELAPSGIRVNAVAPGVIDTDMLACYGPAVRQELAAATPLGRIGNPADVAAAVAFLAGEAASFVTGAVIDVNGGFIT